MIRKEILEDGSFGGNYPEDIEYKNLPEKYILVTEEQKDYIDANSDRLRYIDEEVRDISGSKEYRIKKERERISSVQANYLRTRDAVTNARLNDKDLFECGIITEEVYRTREEVNKRSLLEGWNNYWTEIGVEPPIITK